MSVRNAGKTIREARLKAGLTQEQLAEGVCSTLSLSRIENSSSGVSPITFQALMAHAGAPCEVFPIFANRTDFDCFYTLKRTQYFLNSWQLQETFQELEKVEAWHFANNKFYYQEWLYLQGRLQIRSGNKNHDAILKLFTDALAITRPEIDFSDIGGLLLSIIEIELLTAIAQEFLYLGNSDNCYLICSQITSYLANAELDYLKKDFLEAEYAIVYSKYLFYIKDYKEALSVADTHRHKMVQNSEDAPLLELTFLTALGYYYTGEKDTAYTCFKNTFYSAHAIESYYATICRNYVIKHHLFPLDDYLSQMEDIPQITFPIKKATDISSLSDGTYDLFSPDVLTIGRLIYELRNEQNVSQTTLCQGLCSKSKLSKIEHDALQPDIFLTEALLQRLGISERIFTFWGNKRESKLYELKFKLAHSRLLSQTQKEYYLHEFHSLISNKDILLLQIYTLDTLDSSPSPEERINILFNALSYTLPDFDIRFIHDYRLSWCELSILNNIAFTYRTIDAGKSRLYFSKIMDYLLFNPLDILFTRNVFCKTLYMYAHSLYTQKHFHESCNLLSRTYYNILKGNIATFSYLLFYCCQALGECQQLDSAEKYALYCCSLQELFELTPNSDILKKCFWEDFSIRLS